MTTPFIQNAPLPKCHIQVPYIYKPMLDTVLHLGSIFHFIYLSASHKQYVLGQSKAT